MIQVKDNDLLEIKRILKEIIPEYEVWAFGSRINGNPKPYSDLDLAIITSNGLDFGLKAKLKEQFEISNISFRIDIIDWASISENFRKIIKGNYQIIQKLR